MREIKFRVWSKSKKIIGYIDLQSWGEDGMSINGEDGYYKFDLMLEDLEIMQYTGLKDKNGKEIYEGDILKLDGSDKKKDREVVTFEIDNSNNTAGFSPFCNQIPDACDLYSVWTYDSIEVIGNIYENPELLSNETKS